MKPLLVDTQAYLWFVFDDLRLSDRAAAAIADLGNQPVLSIASLWEIVIKRQIGKLDLGMDFPTFLHRYVEQRLVTVLAVEPPHLVEYDRLPLHHRDPFDRLLAAQARVLRSPIVSVDPSFRRYDVAVVW